MAPFRQSCDRPTAFRSRWRAVKIGHRWRGVSCRRSVVIHQAQNGEQLRLIPTFAGTIRPTQRRRAAARRGTACGATECRRPPPRPAVHRGRRTPHPRKPAGACHAEPAHVKGAHCAPPARQTLDRRGTGAANRPQVRRGGDAAGLAINSMAGGGITCRRFAVLRPRLMNGGGCAAASI